MLRTRCWSGLSSNTKIIARRRASAFLGCTRLQKAFYTSHVGDSIVPATKVEKIIHDTIKATGPMSFARYMQMCLSHPTEGYYMNPSLSVFGSMGDFITSPGISQVFGELIAMWIISQWTHFGFQKTIRLVELGPGLGTLMEDILRALAQIPSSRAAVEQIHLVETSEIMRILQGENLRPLTSKHNWHVFWHNSLEDLDVDKDMFTFIIAHEFFDALPFHLLQKCGDGWREVLIDSGPDPSSPTTLKTDRTASMSLNGGVLESAAHFHPVLSPSPSPVSTLLGASSPRFVNLPVGTRIEVSPSAFKIARRIGELLQSDSKAPDNMPGSALIVDYGHEKTFGSSFRAFKNHKIVDVFHRPGECDLTTNVDFAYLKEAIADLASTHDPIPQATFLERMHIQARIQVLKKAAPDKQRKTEIEGAAQRLMDRTGMGSQYQFMAVTGTRHLQEQPSQEQMWPFVKL